jgi:uncharacterized protein (DUF1800 family)
MILQLANSQGGNRTWLFTITEWLDSAADAVDAFARVGAVCRRRAIRGRLVGSYAEILEAVSELNVEA